jgi:hypothetical protein
MDPNLFHLDWERTFEVLAAIVVLSFLVENALALLFQSRLYINYADERGLKELIAFVVAAFVCWYWEFDAISMIILSGEVTLPGTIITGGIVAGGSKASIKLFRDILGFNSTTFEAAQAAKKQRAAAAAAARSGALGGRTP